MDRTQKEKINVQPESSFYHKGGFKVKTKWYITNGKTFLGYWDNYPDARDEATRIKKIIKCQKKNYPQMNTQ